MRNWCLQCIECSRTVCNRVILGNISLCIVTISPVSFLSNIIAGWLRTAVIEHSRTRGIVHEWANDEETANIVFRSGFPSFASLATAAVRRLLCSAFLPARVPEERFHLVVPRDCEERERGMERWGLKKREKWGEQGRDLTSGKVEIPLASRRRFTLLG